MYSDNIRRKMPCTYSGTRNEKDSTRCRSADAMWQGTHGIANTSLWSGPSGGVVTIGEPDDVLPDASTFN